MEQKEPGLGKTRSRWKKGLVTASAIMFSAAISLIPCQATSSEIYQGSQNESKTIEYVSQSRATEKGKYAVVLIDMQERFLDNINKDELRSEIHNQIEVLGYAQKNNVPIFVLEYANEGCSTTQELKDVLSKSRYELIIKSDNNGFEGTSLDSELRRYGIKEVILMGVNSCSCVKDTAIGALDNGYGIITSPDVIAESEGVKKVFKTGECIDWYEENGSVLENYSELIKFLKK